MGESVSYRSIVVVSQYVSWLFGQLLRLRYSIRAYCPARLFKLDSRHCLILAPTHRTYLDPWLLMVSLGFRLFRALVPVRTLGTQDFRNPLLQRLKPLIKIVYRLEGVIELPPEEHDERSLPAVTRLVSVPPSANLPCNLHAAQHDEKIVVARLWRERRISIMLKTQIQHVANKVV